MPTPDPSTATPTRARRSKSGAYLSSPELARRVRACREAVGLSQSEAARQLGISQQCYQSRESSTTLPASMLVELVQVLGYDARTLLPELFGGE